MAPDRYGRPLSSRPRTTTDTENRNTPPTLLGQLPVREMTSAGVAGHYLRRDDTFVASVSDDQLRSPVPATAVIAHPLAHVRLPGEGRIDPARTDGEQLTDLVTVFFGLGVYHVNASFDFEQSDQGWRTARLGYLSDQMFGYALARYAQLRSEPGPEWATALDTNPRTYIMQATRYLETRHTSAHLTGSPDRGAQPPTPARIPPWVYWW